MADGREDERVNFQFIDETQNFSDLWNVSSSGYNDTKKQAEEALGRACCTLHGLYFY